MYIYIYIAMYTPFCALSQKFLICPNDMCMYEFMNMYSHACVPMLAYALVYMCVCSCMHMCMYICMCVCACVCMHV